MTTLATTAPNTSRARAKGLQHCAEQAVQIKVGRWTQAAL